MAKKNVREVTEKEVETNLLVRSLDELIGDRFGRYSKYIIQDRALPDVRDGLKPVQRRILYAMYADGNIFNKPTRKSAKTVGTVIGNYHPHGDTSVYDAMVRLSQWWKMNKPLIDMQGNNGSIDNDPPAAMRYTEARLASITNELLRDIQKETVSLAWTYDDKTQEPTVLPARFPNLLVNGTKGIASGYATDIPPHNLGEVIDATIMRIKNPKCTLQDLMTVIKGPDFPTGGVVQGSAGIEEAFKSGRGKVFVRAKHEIIESKNSRDIIITELPYDVVKSDLVRSIDEIRFKKEISSIIEVRDESDFEGLRIVIETKKETDVNMTLNYLFKNTNLQTSYNYNMVAIYDKTPHLLSLIEVLDAYIAHQIDVITKSYTFDLNKAKARVHVVDGLVKALSVLDEVIQIIRSSSGKANSKENLMKRFDFTELQAEAIVTLQLYRLSSTDILILNKEKEDLNEQIEGLNKMLNSDSRLKTAISKDLIQIKTQYGTARLSIIEDEVAEIKIDKAAMIEKEDVMVALTRDGYIKRSSLKSYSTSNSENNFPNTKKGDIVIGMTMANTQDVMLLFTDLGSCLYVPVFGIKENKWKEEGVHLNNLVNLDNEEKIVSTVLIKQFKEGLSVALATDSGQIKKVEIEEFQTTKYNKKISCFKLKPNEHVIKADICDNDSEFILLYDNGYMLRYLETQINSTSLRSSGVKAGGLTDKNKLVGMSVIRQNNDDDVFVITNKGGMKSVKLRYIPTSSRQSKGTAVFKTLKSDPHVAVAFGLFKENDLITVLSKENILLFNGDEIKYSMIDKVIKNNLNISDSNKVVNAYNSRVLIIDENTKVYKTRKQRISDTKQFMKLEQKEKAESTLHEKMSIFDLDGNDNN